MVNTVTYGMACVGTTCVNNGAMAFATWGCITASSNMPIPIISATAGMTVEMPSKMERVSVVMELCCHVIRAPYAIPARNAGMISQRQNNTSKRGINGVARASPDIELTLRQCLYAA